LRQNAAKGEAAALASLLQRNENRRAVLTIDFPETPARVALEKGKPSQGRAHVEPTKRGAPRANLVSNTNQIWANWGIIDATNTFADGQLFTRILFRPTTPAEVSLAIQQAEAAGATIRALGSGWSFSDAVLPQTTPTDLSEFVSEIIAQIFGGTFPPLFDSYGFAIDTSSLTTNLQTLLPGIVSDGVDTSLLFFNEAGITVQALNVRLDNQSPPVAMSTLGGCNGQTIAGVISTGTHGSDFDRAPIADSVRALYIIGVGGTHHWVESKSNQFTDPNKVTATFPSIALANCHYDDDLFNAAIVGMGAMGVIYAVVLEVVPQFALIEFNLWSTWEQLQQNAVGGAELTRVAHGSAFPSVNQFLGNLYPPNDPSGMPYSRSLEVVVNPIKNDDGTHNCYATIRFELPRDLVPESWVLPVGVVGGNLGTLTKSQVINAITSSPDCGFW
jgi:FAD/FMN-containing dehydrogenase